MRMIFHRERTGSAGALRGGEARQRLVMDAMSSPAITIESSASVRLAFELTTERPVHHLLVTSRGALAGVICVCELWDAAPAAPVGELAASPPVTISRGATLLQAAARMAHYRLGCLPVPERDRLGVLTRGDLLRAGVDGDFYRRCVYCGSHHHVRSRAEGGEPFCLHCLEASRRFDFDEVYVDLGDGD